MNNKKHFNAKKKKILCLSIKGFFFIFLFFYFYTQL